jgi:hypothetical protein
VGRGQSDHEDQAGKNDEEGEDQSLRQAFQSAARKGEDDDIGHHVNWVFGKDANSEQGGVA